MKVISQIIIIYEFPEITFVRNELARIADQESVMGLDVQGSLAAQAEPEVQAVQAAGVEQVVRVVDGVQDAQAGQVGWVALED